MYGPQRVALFLEVAVPLGVEAWLEEVYLWGNTGFEVCRQTDTSCHISTEMRAKWLPFASTATQAPVAACWGLWTVRP